MDFNRKEGLGKEVLFVALSLKPAVRRSQVIQVLFALIRKCKKSQITGKKPSEQTLLLADTNASWETKLAMVKKEG
jgi:hypothetical protein